MLSFRRNYTFVFKLYCSTYYCVVYFCLPECQGAVNSSCISAAWYIIGSHQVDGDGGDELGVGHTIHLTKACLPYWRVLGLDTCLYPPLSLLECAAPTVSVWFLLMYRLFMMFWYLFSAFTSLLFYFASILGAVRTKGSCSITITKFPLSHFHSITGEIIHQLVSMWFLCAKEVFSQPVKTICVTVTIFFQQFFKPPMSPKCLHALNVKLKTTNSVLTLLEEIMVFKDC